MTWATWHERHCYTTKLELWTACVCGVVFLMPPTASISTAFMYRLAFNPLVLKGVARVFYPLFTQRLDAAEVLFHNDGYEEDPAMGLALAEADEPHRYPIQLYHRIATQTDLEGKRVLEVSSGHGGGASYLTRTLRPASYVGLDLNTRAVAFCAEHHSVPGLSFVQGDAENLPFADHPSTPSSTSRPRTTIRGFRSFSTKWRECCGPAVGSSTPTCDRGCGSPGGRPLWPLHGCECSPAG